MGYQFLLTAKRKKQLQYSKQNIERYPMSANVYDSLAEAYERGGRMDLAAPLYDKARILVSRTVIQIQRSIRLTPNVPTQN